MSKPVHAALLLSLILLSACKDENTRHVVTSSGYSSSSSSSSGSASADHGTQAPSGPSAGDSSQTHQEEAEAGVIAKDDLGRIVIASNLTRTEQARVQSDLRYLKNSSLRLNNELVNKTLGITEANNQVLTNWLSDRLQYIVGKSKDLDALLVDSNEQVAYENPNVLPDTILDIAPDLKDKFRKTLSESKGTTIATNIGSLGYLLGKISQTTAKAIDVPGVGHVVMRSPRIGVIQAAAGYSISLLDFFGIRGSDPNSEANKVNRLSTLFHEARHSDGHGKSMSFMHSKCPEGHDLAGLNACDASLNGPYMVGAVTTAILATNCASCNDAEKEALRLMAMDSAGRPQVADENSPGAYWDATPEGQR